MPCCDRIISVARTGRGLRFHSQASEAILESHASTAVNESKVREQLHHIAQEPKSPRAQASDRTATPLLAASHLTSPILR